MRVQVGEHELFYKRLSEPAPAGPTILALHGGPGLDHTYLARALGPLAAEIDVVVFDQLGAGRSDRPAFTGGMAERADEVVALADALGLADVILFGHSWGSYVALEAALRHPGRFRALILSNSAPTFDYPEVVFANAQARCSPEVFAAVVQGLTQPCPSDEAYRELWNTILPLYFHRFDPVLAEELSVDAVFSAAALNYGMGVCVPGWDTRDRLPTLNLPTLILAGDDDWITPVAQGADRLFAGIPGAKNVVFAEAGHFPFFEQPAGFFATVSAWVADVR